MGVNVNIGNILRLTLISDSHNPRACLGKQGTVHVRLFIGVHNDPTAAQLFFIQIAAIGNDQWHRHFFDFFRGNRVFIRIAVQKAFVKNILNLCLIKLFLGLLAARAHPVIRKILKPCSGFNAMLRIAFFGTMIPLFRFIAAQHACQCKFPICC